LDDADTRKGRPRTRRAFLNFALVVGEQRAQNTLAKPASWDFQSDHVAAERDSVAAHRQGDRAAPAL